jgi:hypothetical protein
MSRDGQLAGQLGPGDCAVPSYVLTGAPGAGKRPSCACWKSAGIWSSRKPRQTSLPSATLWAVPSHGMTLTSSIGSLPWSGGGRTRVRADGDAPVFFDRSPVCTLALNRYLGFTASRLLDEEIGRVVAEGPTNRSSSSSATRDLRVPCLGQADPSILAWNSRLKWPRATAQPGAHGSLELANGAARPVRLPVP